ncbi:hypothetical protein CASFOL_019683 [Castilleja foliolosa]|uniref:Uncharacterized protein n=1 Tax=Castilleja foliolosa TaxID=1961234 RepID=A0ABD3CYR2_9LAMI
MYKATYGSSFILISEPSMDLGRRCLGLDFRRDRRQIPQDLGQSVVVRGEKAVLRREAALDGDENGGELGCDVVAEIVEDDGGGAEKLMSFLTFMDSDGDDDVPYHFSGDDASEPQLKERRLIHGSEEFQHDRRVKLFQPSCRRTLSRTSS